MSALTPADVAAWFDHPAARPQPTAEMVEGLTHFCNLCLIQRGEPPAIAEVTKLERQKEELTTDRIRRVLAALKVLKEDLPVLIAGAEGSQKAAHDAGREPLRKAESTVVPTKELLAAVENCEGVFRVRRTKKAGRRRVWAADGQAILGMAIGAWRLAGCPRRLGANRTGPLQHLLMQALPAIGHEVNGFQLNAWLAAELKVRRI